MKITVIGAASSVGAPVAFYLAAKGLTDEILMIGGKRQKEHIAGMVDDIHNASQGNTYQAVTWLP